VVDYSKLAVSRTTTVAAPPEAVYGIIADVTRIGEMSPICKAAWWDEGAEPADGAAPSLGAWFTGRNEMAGRDPWERRCEIVLAEPGRALGWIAGGRDEGVASWTYQFRPAGNGTEVEESWKIVREDDRISALSDDEVKGLLMMTETGIEATLANLKKLAEA
jgi:uncharacterized protein YndB with AHSA1/START domain